MTYLKGNQNAVVSIRNFVPIKYEKVLVSPKHE